MLAGFTCPDRLLRPSATRDFNTAGSRYSLEMDLPVSLPATAKELALRALARLPDDASAEQIREQLEVVLTLWTRVKSFDADSVVSNEEVWKRFEKWLK